jgi:hypothetical protein
MLRVMFVMHLCDFEREQTPGPERSAERVTEVVGTHTAIWASAPQNRWAYSEIQRRCALIALLLCCALPFVGCVREQQPSPEIVAEIKTLEQRTIAPNSGLQRAASIRKQHAMSVEADWQVRVSSTTREYFGWVKQQLGADYHVVSQTESVLTMGKTLPGDSYTLEFTNGSGSTIDVRFLATGD